MDGSSSLSEDGEASAPGPQGRSA